MAPLETAAAAPEVPAVPALPALHVHRSRLTLRTRILLTLGSVVGAILVVSGALDIYARHDERLEALRLRAALVAQAQSAALANPIWEYDQDAGLAALKGALEDPELVEAIVLDDTGEIFARVARPDARPMARDELVVASRRVELPTPSGEIRPVGSVELRFSRAEVWRKLRVAIVSALLELVALVAVVSLGLVVGLQRFTRPIEELTTIIRRRARGDLSLDVNPAWLAREDEIGAIAQSLELDQQQRRDEAKLLEITSGVSGEAQLETFLRRLADAARDLVEADRCSLFLHDSKRDLLSSVLVDGHSALAAEHRPGHGLAGASFQSGEVLKLDDARTDPRFRADIDELPGAPTRSMLCVPMATKGGARIGVIQVLNRRGGDFTERDELRLRSLAAQAAVAVDNARLLDDVLDEKSYTESILSSLSDGVISLDDRLRVARVNAAGCRILGWREDEVRGRLLSEVLPGEENEWEIALVEGVATSRRPDSAEDALLHLPDGRPASVNLTAVPLTNAKGAALGSLVVVEDITSEKRVRGTMARYLPKKVVDQLLEGDRAVLGGTAQTVTALFSDIRSFTTLSEEIGPRETVAMLNEYFTEMLEVLDRHNGVLDKFIGDAVMAIFGVPFTGPDDADNAVAAANDMMSSLALLNETRVKRGHPAIAIGAGLNTGEAVAGNIGSPKRMSYTVIGDSVNLASRLEGATKQYGVAILLSEFTWAALRDRRYTREVDFLRVKGKTRPVAVYESYAFRPDRDDDPLRQSLASSAEGLRAFRAADWAGARAAFERARKLRPEDRIPAIYLDRIARYEETPPPPDWDGVWVMTSK